MFHPPRCPNASCPYHAEPELHFYRRHGFYKPKCRPHPVPRFRCLGCRRTFSRQTFRGDYRDHRPDLNAKLMELLASGLGLRQISRTLKLSLGCTQQKFRKHARHLMDLNRNLQAPLPEGSSFQLDEFETYEGRRNTRPLTVPVLIERESRLVIWCESAPIRPRGKMTPTRVRAIEADEQRFGPREDRSKEALQSVFEKGRAAAVGLQEVLLETDEKSNYPSLAESAFGSQRLVHRTTNSKLARGTWNPLFPINNTEAMMRDLTGRLRRESWLVSKEGRFLDLGLQVWMTYRNWIRRRFNRDDFSAAQTVGLTDRRWTFRDALSWRQDWGQRSPYALSKGHQTVGEWKRRLAA